MSAFGNVGERRAARAAFVRERVRKLKAEGLTRQEMCERLGVKSDTVRQALQRLSEEGVS